MSTLTPSQRDRIFQILYIAICGSLILIFLVPCVLIVFLVFADLIDDAVRVTVAFMSLLSAVATYAIRTLNSWLIQ